MPSAFELPEGERNPYMYYEEYEAYLAYVNTCESPHLLCLPSSSPSLVQRPSKYEECTNLCGSDCGCGVVWGGMVVLPLSFPGAANEVQLTSVS